MKLTTINTPVVCRNMTRTELIRAAEHAFPYPSPIIHLMLEHLRGNVEPEAAESSAHKPEDAVHCPACGAQLQVNLEDNT